MEEYKQFLNSKLFKEMLGLTMPTSFDLSTDKGRADKKEMGLKTLLEVGYITPVEKEEYAKELQELPTDRKRLVVAYYLENVGKDLQGTADYMEKAYKLIKANGFTPTKYNAALARGKDETEVTLADVMGDEASQEFKAEYSRLAIEERIQIAELFVDTKRKRIKNRLQTLALWLICDELIAEEDGTQTTFLTASQLDELIEQLITLRDEIDHFNNLEIYG